MANPPFKVSPAASVVARMIVSTDDFTEAVGKITRPAATSILGFGLQVQYEVARLREERAKYVLGKLLIRADMIGKRAEALALWNKALRYEISFQKAISDMEDLINQGEAETKTGTKPFIYEDFSNESF